MGLLGRNVHRSFEAPGECMTAGLFSPEDRELLQCQGYFSGQSGPVFPFQHFESALMSTFAGPANCVSHGAFNGTLFG